MKAAFVRFVLSLGLLLCLGLSACQQLGVAPADTFNKKLLSGYTTVQAVADSAKVLQVAGKLSQADRDKVVATNMAAIQALDLAATVHKTDPAAGDAKLQATLLSLQALQAYLQTVGSGK